MKKRRVSHPDGEDPGAICALLGAMKLNVWGGEEDYSVSLEQEEEKSGGQGRAKRARREKGEGSPEMGKKVWQGEGGR